MFQRTSLAALRRSFTLLAISAALFACSSDNDDEIKIQTYNSPLLLNFTSDRTTGVLRWMDPNSTSLFSGEMLFDQDSKVFANGKDIFVLERKNLGATNILSCMQADKIGSETPKQAVLEDLSNPYEIAVIGNKGYIAMYDLDYVQEFDPATCLLGEKIDLPIIQANAVSIKASGDILLVIAQRLEFYAATKPGLLIRINASTKALIDTIQLNFYNPGSSVLSNGKLYISSVDDYFSFANAGIEVVDLAAGISEILVTGAELGGGANYIALDEANQILYVSVMDSDYNTPVKSLTLSNKAISADLPGIISSFGGFLLDSETGRLFIADATGLKIYDTASQQAISVSGDALPPTSLAIARW
ncbi:MAG: hypothetical protein FWB90_09755 [Fibromonadales bacterium]|nr:hypothetical protein [Fibromonadales bacterium]